jgi:hypothetical protein
VFRIALLDRRISFVDPPGSDDDDGESVPPAGTEPGEPEGGAE